MFYTILLSGWADIIVPMMIFSVPLSAIIGSYYIKALKLRNEMRGLPPAIDEEQMAKLRQLENINERVKNLESIITSLDKEILHLKEFDDAQRVKELGDKLK